jgi:hypothetical protein
METTFQRHILIRGEHRDNVDTSNQVLVEPAAKIQRAQSRRPAETAPTAQAGGPAAQAGGPAAQAGGPAAHAGGPAAQAGGPAAQAGGSAATSARFGVRQTRRNRSNG